MRSVPADTPAPVDPELIPRLRRGDPAALTTLYRAYGGELLSLAARFTGSEAEAEDVLHDLIVGLPERMRNYDERGNLRGWLRQVVVNMSLMRLRADKRRNETPLDTAELPPWSSTPSDSGDAIELAIRELSPAIRTVVVMRLVAGYSHREIADTLGISVNASEARLSRGIATLRERLGKLL
jgi:RNA polymerase sigma-70 factor (ECF subfamily)